MTQYPGSTPMSFQKSACLGTPIAYNFTPERITYMAEPTREELMAHHLARTRNAVWFEKKGQFGIQSWCKREGERVAGSGRFPVTLILRAMDSAARCGGRSTPLLLGKKK